MDISKDNTNNPETETEYPENLTLHQEPIFDKYIKFVFKS